MRMNETQVVLEPLWLGFLASGLLVGLWADAWGRNGILLGLVALCLPPVGLLAMLLLGPSEEWRQNRRPLLDRLEAWGREHANEADGSRASSEEESPRRKYRRWAWYLLAVIVIKIGSNACGYSVTEGIVYLVTLAIGLILVIGLLLKLFS